MDGTQSYALRLSHTLQALVTPFSRFEAGTTHVCSQQGRCTWVRKEWCKAGAMCDVKAGAMHMAAGGITCFMARSRNDPHGNVSLYAHSSFSFLSFPFLSWHVLYVYISACCHVLSRPPPPPP